MILRFKPIRSHEYVYSQYFLKIHLEKSHKCVCSFPDSWSCHSQCQSRLLCSSQAMAPLFGGGHENMVDPQIPQAMATLIGILMIHLAPDGGSSGRAQKTGGSNKSETKSHWPFEIHGYLWVLQDPAWTLALNMLIISYLRFQFHVYFQRWNRKRRCESLFPCGSQDLWHALVESTGFVLSIGHRFDGENLLIFGLLHLMKQHFQTFRIF